MNFTRRLLWLAAVSFAAVMMVAVVAGCGSSGGSSSSESSSGGSTEESGSTTAAGSGEESGSGEPFKVVELAPLSGELQPLGEAQLAGAEAAQEVINAEGGILGREVEFEAIDDAGTSAQAVSQAQAIVSSGEHPDLVLPGSTSGETIPILPIFTAAKIWQIGWATSPLANDPEKYPNYFGNSQNGTEEAKSLLAYLEEKGWSKVAAIYPNNELGKTALEEFEAIAEPAGIEITSELVDPESLDVTPALTKLRNSNPQALIAGGAIGPIAGVILKTKTKLGWEIPTIGDASFAANNFGELVPPQDLKGLVLQLVDFEVLGNPAQKTPAFKKFQKALLKRVPEPPFALSSYAISWGSFALADAAATKAGTTELDAVTEALESMKVEEAPLWFQTKQLNFSPTNHYPDYSEDLIFVPAGPRKLGSVAPAAAE